MTMRKTALLGLVVMVVGLVGCELDREEQFDIVFGGTSENDGGNCPDNGERYSEIKDIDLDSNVKVKNYSVVSWVPFIDSYTEGAEPGRFAYLDYGLAADINDVGGGQILYSGQFPNDCPAAEVDLTPANLPQATTCLAAMATAANEDPLLHDLILDVLNSSERKVAITAVGECSGEFNIEYRTVLTVKGTVTLK